MLTFDLVAELVEAPAEPSGTVCLFSAVKWLYYRFISEW